jgi:hypothetical protein
MIRNAVIHLTNEQPLLADLYELPAAGDQGLLCTNLRTMAGQRPVFADHIESVFFFPFSHIRFVEIPAGSQRAVTDDDSATGQVDEPVAPDPEPEPDLEIDEDFLRRIREA